MKEKLKQFRFPLFAIFTFISELSTKFQCMHFVQQLVTVGCCILISLWPPLISLQ